MSAEKNLSIAHLWFEAFNAHNLEKLLSLYDDEAEHFSPKLKIRHPETNGFVTGKDQYGNVMVLGGNQGDAVNIKPFDTGRVTGYRWPAGVPIPGQSLQTVTSDGKVSTNEA
jgi:hypothetical protein